MAVSVAGYFEFMDLESHHCIVRRTDARAAAAERVHGHAFDLAPLRPKPKPARSAWRAASRFAPCTPTGKAARPHILAPPVSGSPSRCTKRQWLIERRFPIIEYDAVVRPTLARENCALPTVGTISKTR